METEIEVVGSLDEAKFNMLKAEFTAKLGKPHVMHRLAMQVSDFNITDIETRIRITDGKAVLMQKVGDWQSPHKQELTVDLPTDAQQIVRLVRILTNQLKTDKAQTSAIMFENYDFDAGDYEVRLSHQWGKEHAYASEVEVKKADLDPHVVASSLGLNSEYMSKDADFWIDFNQKINLNTREMSDEELEKLVQEYLDAKA